MKPITRMILPLFLLLVTLSALIPPACGGVSSDHDQVITITDDQGITVTIQGYPQRIVSLAPSNTEILFALGLGERVVGVADLSDYPPLAAAVPQVGGYSTISVEKVIALEPDLIVAVDGNTEEVLNRLRTMGQTVIVLNPETMDEVIDNINLIGEITGVRERAALLNEELKLRISIVTERTGAITERPTVAHVVWHEPVWVSGDRTFQNEVMKAAGGENVFDHLDEWEIVGLEEFIVTNPDYIFVSSGTGMGTASQNIIYNYFMTEPRFQNLNAVKNNHVILVDADIISRAGPRIVDALEEVAAAMHPELFDTTAEKEHAPAEAPVSVFIPVMALLLTVGLLLGNRV